jgi:hypothetical protein
LLQQVLTTNDWRQARRLLTLAGQDELANAEIALAAVGRSGSLLRFLSSDMKGNRAVV